jgi:hypothetical protein
LRRGVEPGHALQQQVAQATRQLTAAVAGDGEEFFGEEEVAFGAGDDRVGQRHRQGRVGASRQQRRQLLALERAQLQQQRRARAPHAVGEPAHALGRGGLVRAVGRQHHDPPVVEVVGEEDDQIERGGIGPVHILEHQQHRYGSRALAEQRQRLLEHAQLRGRRRPVDLPERSERAQGLDEGLIRQLRADQIDRAAEKHLELRAAGTRGQLGGQPGLADARLPGDQDGRPAPRPRGIERTLELPELASASDQHRARASLHSASITPPAPGLEGACKHPRPEDRSAGGQG